ncbi:MAG: O-antigen ligase [Henriciella sp.]|nr:O-antigen ligase [Henriciella sp.]
MPKDKSEHTYPIAELAAFFVALVLFSEGLLPRLVTAEEVVEGTPILRVAWLPIYALVLAGVIWQAKAMALTALRVPFLILLLGLAALSFTWSIDTGLTQRRAVAIVMTTLTGLYIGTRYDWRTLLRVIGLTWLTIASISALVAILVPGFGVHQDIHPGAWRGMYYEKNQLGAHMAAASFICGFMALMDTDWRRVWVIGFGICTGLVLMSTSTTALLALLLGTGILVAALWMKRGQLTTVFGVWIGCVAVLIGSAILVLAPELILSVLGKDATLTGRTDIWSASIEVISERPWLGYGYGAFWAPDSEPAFWVREVLEWESPTAHNAWLDIAIALGLIGLVLFGLNFALTLGRAIRLAVTTWTGVLALGLCCQFLLFSLSESNALQQNSITWIIYVAIAAKLANPLSNRQPRQP